MNNERPSAFEQMKPVHSERTKPVNERHFTSIESTADLAEALEDTGLIPNGVALSDADFTAIMRRADVLMNNDSTLDESQALVGAYVDRMSVKGKIGVEILKRVAIPELTQALQSHYGEDFSEQEVQLFLKYLESGHHAVGMREVVDQWKAERDMTLAGGIPDGVVSVEKDDSVVSYSDAGVDEAHRKALNDRDGGRLQ
jgi:hypothetical protein